MRISRELEIAQAPDSKPAQERPKKQERSEQECAVEKCLELKLCERGEHSVGREPLRGPEEDGGGNGPEQNRGGEIAQQSGCVLQEANVRFPPDAESTHMEGEGRGRAEA